MTSGLALIHRLCANGLSGAETVSTTGKLGQAEQALPCLVAWPRRIVGGAAPLSWVFQSPTGNIACHMSETGAACDIREYHYVPPPRPQNCQQAWGDRIAFEHGGGPAFFGCHSTSFLGQLPTQNYDIPLSSGAITCEINEITGVTCRDTSTGHFFQMSQQSYQLG